MGNLRPDAHDTVDTKGYRRGMATTVTSTLNLPRLLGSRTAARMLAAELDVAGQELGEATITARDLEYATGSAADELVLQLLVNRKATRLILERAGQDFIDDMNASAARRNVADRLRVAPPS